MFQENMKIPQVVMTEYISRVVYHNEEHIIMTVKGKTFNTLIFRFQPKHSSFDL